MRPGEECDFKGLPSGPSRACSSDLCPLASRMKGCEGRTLQAGYKYRDWGVTNC